MTTAVAAAIYEQYAVVDDNEADAPKPLHADAYIEPPCCTSPDPDTGYFSCGCGGQPVVVCPAVDCPGITDDEAEAIFERLGQS